MEERGEAEGEGRRGRGRGGGTRGGMPSLESKAGHHPVIMLESTLCSLRQS